MKAKVGALSVVGALLLLPAHAALGGSSARAAGCGPKLSLLLWPKGYAAYPLPNFEVFRGLTGPYGISNILAYGAATKDGTLGYPASTIGSDCIDYGSAGKTPTPASLAPARSRAALRLSCSFPKAPIVEIDRLPQLAKRVRVILPPGTVVADAHVTTHGSSLTYASRYCVRKQQLISPSS
jgi:hypothetical protein